MKTILCVMVAMMLTGAAVADDRTVALDYEKKLDKQITLSVRAATLTEVLAEVEKATGVHLLVQREVAGDKATVCVKDQPARDVLRTLAHCFNLGWSPSPRTADKPYLRLWMDRDYVSSMGDREYQDYLAISYQFDRELKATAEYVRTGTEFVLDDAARAKLYKDDKAEWVRQGKRRDITLKKPLGAMVLQFLALSDKQRESLFGGNHVAVSGAEVSADALKRWPEAKSFDYAIDRTTSGCILRCAGRPGAGTYSISSAYFNNSRYIAAAELAAKQILTDPKLDKALPEGTKFATEAAVGLGEGSGTATGTMGDGLLELAKATDIPIVAQYVSEYKGASVDWAKQKVQLSGSGAKKIAERLAELGRGHLFAIVRDGQFLVGKSLLWHRQRLAEVPEAKIRAWQKESSGLLAPTLKGFVDMASMRWEQVRATISNARFWFGDQRLLPLAECEYALKIYGSLTQDQQQWLMSGQELPVSTLTPQQQMYFMCGFEVRERPTFENATDQNWPKTASISFKDFGIGDTRICACAGMRALGEVSPEKGAINIPDKLTMAEALKIFNTQMNAVQPSLVTKLRDQVAKDHPEVAAKNVAIYNMQYCAFIFKLGQKTRQCELLYSTKVK